MDVEWNIDVANPSPYVRSDYVEADLQAMGVPPNLGEDNLKLFRVAPGSGAREEVPYQIDKVLGTDDSTGLKRVLTFLSTDTPAGDPHYQAKSIRFVLQRGTPRDFSGLPEKKMLWVGQYYEDRRNGEPQDGYGEQWDTKRRAYGVKLGNGRIELFFSLVPHLKQRTDIDYTGSVTSLWFKDPQDLVGAGEMLAPFHDVPAKRWGQITDVAFFPLPWELRWFSKISLLGRRYELVWSHSGPMRATFTVRSEPFDVEFHSEGLADPPLIKLTCRLYRVISAYAGKPFFAEDVFVLTSTGRSVSFRPYYYANLGYPGGVTTELKRFEHIPDYLAIWKHFCVQYRGLGFASDTHIRAIDFSEHEPRWRLQLGHLKRCIHYCMFHGLPTGERDLFHEIGHSAWYERVFKPLRVVPFQEFSMAKQYSFG